MSVTAQDYPSAPANLSSLAKHDARGSYLKEAPLSLMGRGVEAGLPAFF